MKFFFLSAASMIGLHEHSKVSHMSLMVGLHEHSKVSHTPHERLHEHSKVSHTPSW